MNNKTANINRLVVFGMASMFFVYSTGRADAASPWVEKAEKEGRVVLYTSFSQADLQKLTSPFSKMYPGVQLKVVRGGSGTLVPKIMAEQRAGRPLADLIFTKADYLDLFQTKGLLQKYDSPERKSDMGGYWTGVYFTVHGIAYNTRTVPPNHMPKHYIDLLDPRWNGKIVINLNNFMWSYAMLDFFGREKGMDFLKKLAAQNARAQRGSTISGQLIAAMEFEIGVSLNTNDVSRMKQQGAPIDWARIKEPLYADLHPIGILVGAPHPHAARLFVDYLLSREGQTAIAEMGRTAIREDVPLRDGIDRKKLRVVGPGGRAEADKYQTLMIDLFAK